VFKSTAERKGNRPCGKGNIAEVFSGTARPGRCWDGRKDLPDCHTGKGNVWSAIRGESGKTPQKSAEVTFRISHEPLAQAVHFFQSDGLPNSAEKTIF